MFRISSRTPWLLLGGVYRIDAMIGRGGNKSFLSPEPLLG